MANEMIYRASRGKAMLLLLGSIGFVAGGYWMSKEEPLVGWLCVVFFGLGIPTSLLMMSPKGMSLRLDEDGFEMSSLVKKVRTRWAAVEVFRIGAIHGAKMIEVVYKPEYAHLKNLRKAVGALSGMEGAIPNSYNVSLTELERVLNEWRERYSRTG